MNNLNFDDISYLIVHHTGVNTDSDQFDSVENYHKNKGWGQIGYHFFIEKDGRLENGRPENVVGYHCQFAGHNFNSLGICVAGDYTSKNITKEAKKTLIQLLDVLRIKYDIPKSHIIGHNEVGAVTLCPGTIIKDLSEYRLNKDINYLLDGGNNLNNKIKMTDVNNAYEKKDNPYQYGYDSVFLNEYQEQIVEKLDNLYSIFIKRPKLVKGNQLMSFVDLSNKNKVDSTFSTIPLPFVNPEQIPDAKFFGSLRGLAERMYKFNALDIFLFSPESESISEIDRDLIENTLHEFTIVVRKEYFQTMTGSQKAVPEKDEANQE